MPSASPAGPSPIPAPGGAKRKKSGVFQSSLDLVFSYSRSQQLLYGKHLHSAPSFLETSSHSWSAEYLPRDEEEGGEGGEGELEEGDEALDVDREEPAREAAHSAGDGAIRPGDRRRSSGSPNLFPYDPITPGPGIPPAGPPSIRSVRSVRSGDAPRDNASTGSSSTEPTPRAGLLNLLPEPVGIGRVGQAPGSAAGKATGARRMFSGDSVIGAVGGSGGGGRHPAQRVFEGVGPDERTPLVSSQMGSGPEEGRRVSYASNATSTPTVTNGKESESEGQDVRGQESGRARGLERRRSSAVRRLSDAVARRESMVGGRRVSLARSRRRSEVFRGESTDGQTLFNAVAVLLGIGILSLPLAFAYAGWIGGTAMLLGFAWLTCHTAKLLARLIQADSGLMGYTDIGRLAFGRAGGIGINLLFCLELFALGVALIVLFGDTLEVIFPTIPSNTWKLLGLVIILPTTLLPLHLLSLPSLLSTLSTLLLVLIILIDGFIKTTSPGSIIHPAPTRLGPEIQGTNWLGGIGLVLAGFGGHAVVPSLARDMRHPERFDKIISQAFAIAAGVSLVAGAAGYLMIGNDVSDEITRDLMQPKYGYPRWLNLFALWMIVVIPLTKFGLCSRPLNLTIEGLLGITSAQQPIALPPDGSGLSDPLLSGHSARDESAQLATSPTSPAHQINGSLNADGPEQSKTRPEVVQRSGIPSYKYLRVISRSVVTCLCTATAIALPGFGKVMAFLGSFSAFLICIILPLLFYLRLSPRLVSPSRDLGHRAVHWFLICISAVFMVAGTVWAFLPGSGHGDVVS